MTDLADRPNPSHWRALLTLALPVLDHAYRDQKAPTGIALWTLGGGTAIALRLAHRISDDVDLFVGATDLREFTPTRNPHAGTLRAGMQFPGNYLKYLREDGEIDFLPGPLISSPGYSWETFDQRPVALQTCEEVILKKVRYRSGSFKARDAFDLAAVAKISTTLGALLVSETGDMLPTLLTSLRRHSAESLAKANIRALPDYEFLMSTATMEASTFIAALVDRMEA